ncbi:MAG: hypothetical protein AVDCRST_MAG06-2550 [uncultured Nocardioides sp.]|uniref:DUF4229 domain-containing protein n=1 Tax=uncultured Nocardioides sp. TaxID=198441 RepID=A0A6J4P5B3_9ACTN|nr:MAG: hypothetical protein AVDCRST_MAG06-2550 [uncultured Nocardioides sp.]
MTAYPGGVKEFVVYTAMRLLVFVASLLIVVGVWSLVAGRDSVHAVWTVVLAFIVSGIASYFLLNRQREAFARRVEERAHRASAAFEERRGREDVE